MGPFFGSVNIGLQRLRINLGLFCGLLVFEGVARSPVSPWFFQSAICWCACHAAVPTPLASLHVERSAFLDCRARPISAPSRRLIVAPR